jgi:hypothetical protein
MLKKRNTLTSLKNSIIISVSFNSETSRINQIILGCTAANPSQQKLDLPKTHM